MQPHHSGVHQKGGPAIKDDKVSAVKFERIVDMKIDRVMQPSTDEIVLTSNSPITFEIMAAVLPKGAKVPATKQYNGKTNLLDFL